eukprot:11376043-Ditylum_brightwellii.AAC.1
MRLCQARGTIPEPNDHDKDGQEYVAPPLLTQEDLEQTDIKNEDAIAKKDGSVVHTEDIGSQETRGTILEPNDHDEDG